MGISWGFTVIPPPSELLDVRMMNLAAQRLPFQAGAAGRCIRWQVTWLKGGRFEWLCETFLRNRVVQGGIP